MFSQNFSSQIAISTNRLLNIPYVYPIVCFMTRVRRILQRPQFQFPPFNFRYLWSRTSKNEIDTLLCGFYRSNPCLLRESFTDQCDQFLLLESCSGRGSLFTTFSFFIFSWWSNYSWFVWNVLDSTCNLPISRVLLRIKWVSVSFTHLKCITKISGVLIDHEKWMKKRKKRKKNFSFVYMHSDCCKYSHFRILLHSFVILQFCIYR